jgi:hypothetical protein
MSENITARNFSRYPLQLNTITVDFPRIKIMIYHDNNLLKPGF